MVQEALRFVGSYAISYVAVSPVGEVHRAELSCEASLFMAIPCAQEERCQERRVKYYEYQYKDTEPCRNSRFCR